MKVRYNRYVGWLALVFGLGGIALYTHRLVQAPSATAGIGLAFAAGLTLWAVITVYVALSRTFLVYDPESRTITWWANLFSSTPKEVSLDTEGEVAVDRGRVRIHVAKERRVYPISGALTDKSDWNRFITRIANDTRP